MFVKYLDAYDQNDNTPPHPHLQRLLGMNN